ncbi:carbohydrate kinase family protein [bacterium]|nr:carbohydrate kinase family protein [bacterium]
MAEVICAGIVVADTFCGPLQQLPAPGELLAVDRLPGKAGGCAANVAIDLVKQGVSAAIAGGVGDDAEADALRACLAQAGVDSGGLVRQAGCPTSKTVILLVEGEDRRFIHAFGANARFAVADIPRDAIAAARVFYFGGLFAMPGIDFAELGELLQFCRARGVITVLDVVVPRQAPGAGKLARVLPHTDWFVPNDDEARHLTGETNPENQIGALRAMGAREVIITCGSRGAVAARGQDRWQCGVYPATVVDPSGAGDAYAAGIVTGLARAWEMARLLQYAAALGASSVRAIGTTDGVFAAVEAEAFVASHPLPLTHRPPGSPGTGPGAAAPQVRGSR